MKFRWKLNVANCNLGKVDPMLIQLRAFSLSVGDLLNFCRVFLLAVDFFGSVNLAKLCRLQLPPFPTCMRVRFSVWQCQLLASCRAGSHSWGFVGLAPTHGVPIWDLPAGPEFARAPYQPCRHQFPSSSIGHLFNLILNFFCISICLIGGKNLLGLVNKENPEV